MSLIIDNKYTYDCIAEWVAKEILTGSYRMIGITGTSCVGKSTFTNMIKKHLEEAEYTTQIVRVDDYLCKDHRGVTQFWNRQASSFLKPEYFNWSLLQKDTVSLCEGTDITGGCYTRGVGWETKRTMKASDCLFVEGLFLDSVQAAEYMRYDLLISLTAADELITKLRMERDDYYRQNYENFRRTKSETLKEIEDTLLAGKSYEICKEKRRYLKLEVLEKYMMMVMEDER